VPAAGWAELDVWSANARGVYSEVPGGWCRGKVRADADGYYKFETVYRASTRAARATCI
jgi:protocatechuate 3,4-dioxygenase beta subunit